MQIVEGLVVRSAAGHDKGGFFVVIRYDETCAYLADGKRRPLETPKKKKFRHLAMTADVIPASSLKTNKQIRKALHPYNFMDQAAQS